MRDPLIIGTNDHVLAIEALSGSTLWETKLSTGGFFSSTSYEDVTVLVKENFVFAGSMGHVFCLDRSTGAILWHNDLKGFGHNDVSLAMDGIVVQQMTKVVRSHSNSVS